MQATQSNNERLPMCSNQSQAADCVAVVNAVQRIHCAGTHCSWHTGLKLVKSPCANMLRIPEHQGEFPPTSYHYTYRFTTWSPLHLSRAHVILIGKAGGPNNECTKMFESEYRMLSSPELYASANNQGGYELVPKPICWLFAGQAIAEKCSPRSSLNECAGQI